MRKVAILMFLSVAAAWPQCKVMDDFTAGKVRASLRTSRVPGARDHPFRDGLNLNPIPFAGNPFCVDFLFSNFITGAPGVTHDFAGKGINAVDFIFQSGSVIGADEFAITKIETTTGVAACVVAPPL